MSEAVLDESIDTVRKTAAQYLAELLGNRALAEQLETKLDDMDEFARATAVQGLAMLVTALKTVPDQIEQDAPALAHIDTIHLVESTVEVPEVPQNIIIEEGGETIPGHYPENVIEELAPKRVRTYIGKIFDNDATADFTKDDAAVALGVISELYLPINRKVNSAKQQVLRLGYFFQGKNDEEIASLVGGVTPSAITQGRGYVLKTIKEYYNAATLAEAFDVVQQRRQLRLVTADSDMALVEDVEPVAPEDSIPEIVDKTTQILTEYGVEEQAEIEAIQSPKEQLLAVVEEKFGEEVVASIKVLLEGELMLVSTEAALAREKLAELMQKYAPRYFAKLGIRQDEWNTLSNVIGHAVSPKTIKQYHSIHSGKYSLHKTSALEQFVTGVNFLLGQYVSGAPEVPPARNVARPPSFR